MQQSRHTCSSIYNRIVYFHGDNLLLIKQTLDRSCSIGNWKFVRQLSLLHSCCFYKCCNCSNCYPVVPCVFNRRSQHCQQRVHADKKILSEELYKAIHFVQIFFGLLLGLLIILKFNQAYQVCI